MESIVRDLKFAPSGQQKIDWVRRNMPLLRQIEDEFIKDRPFQGLRVALSVHLEAKTAYLCKVLASGGAEMYVTGSNPLSTQDDVAAALAQDGLCVSAWHGATDAEYQEHILRTLSASPQVIIDDGGDLVNTLYNKLPDVCPQVLGGCEETTTGVLRLKAMERENILPFPMINVNDATCKHLFDNRYGTGQSVWTGINRTTNLIVAGKTVVAAGYGWCGKGVAMRAKGLGAKVIVTEIDPVKALEAVMDGFSVMKMEDAAPLGDIFITVTGCEDVVSAHHFPLLKDGAILCNAGHFDCEVNVKALTKAAVSTWDARQNIKGYTLSNGRSVFVLGEGRLVNLACGDGHPAEIMDMSFAIQALSARYIVENHGRLTPRLLSVPQEIDRRVAELKLSFLNLSIDTLTPQQSAYLGSWQG